MTAWDVPAEPGDVLFAPGRTDPDLITLFKDWSYLTTGPQGDLEGGRLQGFFAGGTCLVDLYRIFVNRKRPRCSFAAQTRANHWTGSFIIPRSSNEGDLPAGKVPLGPIEVRLDRIVDGGWKETLSITNHAGRARRVELALEWNCPLRDTQPEQAEKHPEGKITRGIRPEVDRTEGLVTFRYRKVFGLRRRAPTEEFRRLFGKDAPKEGDPVERELQVSLFPTGAPSRVRISPGSRTKVVFRMSLPARAEWTIRLDFQPIIDRFAVPAAPNRKPAPVQRTRIRTGNATVNQILSQAAEDLEALSLSAMGPAGAAAGVPPGLIAGVPRYVGVFGRDLLTAGWQASIVSPRLMEDSVSRTALYLGVRQDDWRDEEPDRILHERRWNPNAELGRSNREIYYGDVAATPFWVVTLASAYNWNGRRDFLDRHVRTLEACCRWIRRKLREGGGFVYYQSRSSEPNRNQGWKDSGDAIVDARGRVHVAPLAVAEVQGYCFLALLAAAELAMARQALEEASEFFREAMSLRHRFNRAFWMSEEKFYAMALDERLRKVDGVGSNIGHCLGCGIVEQSKAAEVVRRLLSPDMFSGWGIRTLSTKNPAYDPFSYHRGSVWPVENGTISAGLRLVGYHDQAAQVIGGQFAAAAHFPALRLPEVISGHARTRELPVPSLYPEANLLQAWSTSSALFFIWVLLGLRPLAPLRTLLVKPHLPDWLPWVELEGLQVGQAQVSLSFWRKKNGGVGWKILEKKGSLLVLEQPLELDPAASIGKRFRDLLRSAI